MYDTVTYTAFTKPWHVLQFLVRNDGDQALLVLWQ